ncbi:MAG: phage baseplate assembly protein V [Alphaproteobacteria bacterium]
MEGDFEAILERVSEFQRTRHFGKYRGLVSDIDDPEGLGRIKAEVPAIYGDQVSPWAMPCLPFAGPDHGLALIPEIGDGVWIEFEGGDLSRPIWSGCWWADGQRPDPASNLARLLSTGAGHQIVIDEDGDTIRLVHPGGAEIVIGQSEITISIGQCKIRLTASEINLNNGMVKVTTAGASLVNDALKVGA